MFDWQDLKYFLAVARCGSTTAAAKSLGVDQSTVQRRMVELERRMGHALLMRKASGYELTPMARELLPMVEKVALDVQAIEQRLNNVAPDGREIIRLTCPEPVVGRLQPLIERFHQLHPRYKVEFVTSDRYLDLLNGEADAALRSGDTEDELIGLKVADSVWGVYASVDYVDKHGKPESVADLDQHVFVTLDHSTGPHRLIQWLREAAPHAEIASRSNSILGLVQAAKSGMGLAALPMSIAEEAGLVKVLAPIPELTRVWKLLTHPRLRDVARISALFDFFANEAPSVRRALQ